MAISLGLENAVVLNDIGVLYEQINLPGKAEGYYLKAIQLDKDYLPSYTNLAYLYSQRGDSEKASEYFRKRYEHGPQGDPWTEKALEELLKIQPDYQDVLLEKEVRSLNEEMNRKVQAEFETVIQRAKEHYERGIEYSQENEFDKAIFEYNRSLNLTPNIPRIVRARKEARMALSRHRLGDYYRQAVSKLERGDVRGAQMDIRRSLESLSGKSSQTDPSQDENFRDYFQATGEEPMIDPAHDQLVSMAIEHYLTGQELFEKGKMIEAIGEFNRALSFTPKNPMIVDAIHRARYELAKINVRDYSSKAIQMLELGDAKSAEHEIERLLKNIKEGQRPGPEEKARLNQEWITEAFVDFEKQIIESDEHYEKGLKLHEDGQYQAAVKAFDHALYLTPRNPKIIEAKEKSEIALVKENIKNVSDEAVALIELGNTSAAKKKLEALLSRIPGEQVLTPQ